MRSGTGHGGSDRRSPPVRMALIGLGKISMDQHLPAIASDEAFSLAGAVSPRSRLEGVSVFEDLATLLSSASVDAVAVNTPPQVRHRLARQALEAGKHVLLEKPPGATVAEVRDLEVLALARGLTLYTGWHSQHAPGVEPARAWLRGKQVRRVAVNWCENVRQWHPGQTWIWKPGGLGVFDPGVNALSILTRILPERVILSAAQLEIPGNRHTPIAATLKGATGLGVVSARFDFLQTGQQTWSIDVETDRGALSLAMGGAKLMLDGVMQALGPSREYPALYRRFAELVAAGASEVDLEPLALTADAFLIAETVRVDDFHD